ncbi:MULTISPECIES: hypothetical protein [unclassified Lacinutrix]
MESIKGTNLYSEVLKEFNYVFGDVFIFDGFVVSEIEEGIIFSWEAHAERVTKDISSFLGTDGSDLIYISNRVHSYSVMATDWIQFFKNRYNLQGYYVVGHEKSSLINTMFENLFFKSKIRKFTNIESAVALAKDHKFKVEEV